MRRPNDGGLVSPTVPDPGPAATLAAPALPRQRRQVWLLTAGAVLLLLGAVTWFLCNERGRELDAASALSARRAALLADDVTQALEVARAAIAGIELRLQGLPAGAALGAALGPAAAERASLLAALALPLELHVLDASGQAIDLGIALPRHGVTRPVQPLSALAAAGAGWAVETTQRGAGSRVVPLLRAAAPNAHGVAAFAVDLDHAALLARLEGSRTPQGGSAALFRAEPDGSVTLLARAPQVEAEIGQRVRGAITRALAQAPRGTFHAETQFDRTQRVVAYQRLAADAGGMVAVYAVATDAVLADWMAELPIVAVVTALLAAGMLWGGRRLDQSIVSLARGRQALERSESHFRTLADNLPDVVLRLDTRGRYMYANAAIEQASGLPPAAFIGKTGAVLGMPAQDLALWRAALGRVFEHGRTERLEFALAGPHGLRHWESLLTLEPQVAGEEPKALVISRDISQRIQAEQARESLNRHVVGLLDGMSDAFVSLDRQWCCRYVNRKAGEMFGRDPASLLGKHIWTEFPAGVGQPFHRACERAMNEGVACQLEEYYPPFDAWFENRIQPTPDGISIFFTDISERKRREAELKRLHATLDALVQGSTDAIFVKDTAGRYIVANRAMARLLGRPVAEILGADDSALFPADLAERFRADDRRVMQSRSTEAYEEPVVTAHGPRSHLTTKGALLIDGAVHGVFGISRDITEQAEAVRRLRDSEVRHRELFEANPHPMWVYDLETLAFLAVNDAAVKQYGYSRAEFLRMTIKDIRPTEDVARLLDNVSHVTEGIDEAGGWRHLTRDGRLLEVEITSHVLAFNGRPAELVLSHDVTQRNAAERALRHSELRFRLAASYGQVWEWDFGAGSLAPTAEFFVVLGHAAPALDRMAAAFEAIVHPDDYRQLKDVLRLHLRRLGPYQLQFRAFDAERRVRWFETQGQAVWDKSGRATYIAGTTFEITARRQAEDEVRQLATELEQRVRERTAELARSEARYRTIFETVPVSIGEEDWSGVQALLRELRASGVSDVAANLAAHPEFVQQCLRAVRVVRLNQKALSLHDAQRQASDLYDLQAVFPTPADLPQFVGELEALWQGRRLYSARRSLPSLAGRPLQLMMTMSLPALDDDDATALVCLVDITEIDRLNDELDRSLARLRQVNQELETFTYSVSHDLKAPLRGIDGYSRLLLSDHQSQLDDEGRQFLAHIRQATQHMAVLIDDLLAYSRLERRELTLAGLPLAALVDGVLATCRRELSAQGVELTVEVATELHARADAQGLTIALRNLVDNALKFSRHSQPPRVRVAGTRVAGGVQLTVQDNGLGFDMKYHDRIFAIFQRLHRAEDYPGTGVGLAIVRKAVERMGGRVWAESRPEHGSTFTIELPEAP